MSARLCCALILVAAGLIACTAQPPIRIGFIGGLSDRGSDNSEEARNSVILAFEQRNAIGGIAGRKLELLVQDDGQDPTMARAGINALLAANVDAIIGPFTSSIAAVILPRVNDARTTMISPLITSIDFLGKDDHLIRLNRTTRDNGRDYAQLLHQRGQRRLAVAFDLGNTNFTASWLGEFRTAFSALGGHVVVEVGFESQANTAFGDVMQSLVATQPDGLLFVANTVDVTRLALQAVRFAPGLPISASEWASSETLIRLGGRSVEGLVVAQAYDRDDPSTRYRSFVDAYVARFAKNPGYSSVAAYDAATILLSALSRKAATESVKDAVLKYGPYEGLQQDIVFDRFGDTHRTMFFTQLRAGQYVPVN